MDGVSTAHSRGERYEPQDILRGEDFAKNHKAEDRRPCQPWPIARPGPSKSPHHPEQGGELKGDRARGDPLRPGRPFRVYTTADVESGPRTDTSVSGPAEEQEEAA